MTRGPGRTARPACPACPCGVGLLSWLREEALPGKGEAVGVVELVVLAVTFVFWLAAWALSALLLGATGAALGGVAEHYLAWTRKGTRWIGCVAFWLCPAVAFVATWTVAGLLLGPELHRSVRYGSAAAGIVFASLGVLVVTSTGSGKGKSWEAVLLAGSLLTDGLGCAALIWFFPVVERYAAWLGG